MDETELENLFAGYRSDPRNEHKFADWYREVYPDVLRFALRLTGTNLALAQDFCQQAVLRAIEGGALQDRVTSHAHAVGYLKLSIRNLFSDHLRRSGVESRVAKELATWVKEQPAGPEQSLEAREWVAEVASQLTAVDRQVLSGLVAGHSLGEIAQRCSLSYTNAGVRAHRIRQKIRELESSRAAT